jgi:hypothetical protein
MTAGVCKGVEQGGAKWESVVYSGVGVEAIGDVVGPSAPPASASLGAGAPGASLADTGAFLSERSMDRMEPVGDIVPRVLEDALTTEQLLRAAVFLRHMADEADTVNGRVVVIPTRTARRLALALLQVAHA